MLISIHAGMSTDIGDGITVKMPAGDSVGETYP